MTTGIRINELKLAGSAGTDRAYGATFRAGPGESFRALSVIAGAFSTGKTTIIDYIRYCLGDDEHPQHPEVIAAVRAALVEVELNGNQTVIERATGGSPSKFASVWHKGFDDLTLNGEQRISAEPPSDPDGLSQFILAACDLSGIELPEAPTKEESRTHLLSIRDMFRVMFVPNERLDNRNLVFEQSNFMVRQKFLQTIDVMFDVHDNQSAVLAQRLSAANQAARAAQRAADALRDIANQDHPRGLLILQAELDEANADIADLQKQIVALDADQRSTTEASVSLRATLIRAQKLAADAQVRLRNRESLLDRLHALRAQYADDKRKLNFLKDAERLFDPLQVVVCPACMTRLVEEPNVLDGTCSLCKSPFPASSEGADAFDATDASVAIIEREIRAVSRRMESLNEYVERLGLHAAVLRDDAFSAAEQAHEAAAALDDVTSSPAPWLAIRDGLTGRLTEARLAAQSANAGVLAWTRVENAEREHERKVAEAQRISEQRRKVKAEASRNTVISNLSRRFGEILQDFQYPKLQNPFIDNNLIPHVRNQPYTAASSGGMVLIGLAWNLALWEIAFEQGAAAPGLLVIDSPHKNLGFRADDEDFADATLVENFYKHAYSWLQEEGTGAQLIVVDNSPPDLVPAEDVVVRYTGRVDQPPYGLIDDATA